MLKVMTMNSKDNGSKSRRGKMFRVVVWDKETEEEACTLRLSRVALDRVVH